MRPNQRRPLLFPANLLRFPAFLAHSRTKADARAIGLRKQKIGKWRQAAVPNPS
jgi:hypothetical protein